MKRNLVQCLTILLIVITIPLLCFAAEYKVVIKKNGKMIEGKLKNETETTITIVSSGAQLTFKKADLDLEKMKELNANYQSPSQSKTIDRPVPVSEPKKDNSPLSEIARMSEEARKGESESTQSGDPNEKAMANHIADLEQQSKRMDVSQAQQQAYMTQLVNARKGLTNYRSRNTQQLSKSDHVLMLEQLIKALEAEIEKEKQKPAPSDDKILMMRKNINEKQDELSRLQR